MTGLCCDGAESDTFSSFFYSRVSDHVNPRVLRHAALEPAFFDCAEDAKVGGMSNLVGRRGQAVEKMDDATSAAACAVPHGFN